ncbi:hypothetical protein AJ88_42940 [Mesorhizobium amorphae CCBAU 01583]|nr:hypothetical protein AJ88_42940 [Mesorhizobium amorphae CCBAU 01583]
MRPEALHQMKCGCEPFGRAEAGFGAEKKDTGVLARQGDGVDLIGMEQRLQRFCGHSGAL